MNTATWRAWDQEFLWHPFTPMAAYQEENAPIIASAEGFFLIDTDGNRYLDGISSLWCNVHGHRVPEIDNAIRAQLDRVAHSTLLGLSNVPAIELARELVQRAPRGLTKVFYSDSGATAVEVALKLAFQYHQQRADGPRKRDLFLCLADAYHGDTVGAVSVGGMGIFHQIYERLLFPTVKVPAPVAYRIPAGYDPNSYLQHCYTVLEEAVVSQRDRLAAIVIEPLVQGAAGILVHPPGYLRRVRQLASDHDILFIADEVAVGCGRTGTFFACQQEDVSPDFLCVAKGLTGGYLPVAATLTTQRVYDAFLAPPSEGKTFFHGHTFTGNPLGCAAALASLKLFDDRQILANVQARADQLSRRLEEPRFWPHVGEVRQKGLMVGVELVAERATKARYPAAERRGHQVTLAARRRGVILRPLSDVIVLMPPLAIPADLLDHLCDVAFASIREVCEK